MNYLDSYEKTTENYGISTENTGLSQSEPKITIKSVGDVAQEAKQEINRRTQKADMPTGFKAIDSHIYSLRKKELAVIGGRPGEGKTSLALNIAWNLAVAGKGVMYVSLEMAAPSLLERLFYLETNTHNNALWRGFPPEMEIIYNQFCKTLQDLDLGLVDNVGSTFDSLHYLLTHLDHLPDIVFIDYVQMISQRGFGGRQEAVSEYTRNCYELAKELGICIFVLSQLKRGSGEHPTLEDLKWTGSLEENADQVMLCHWPYASGSSEDKNDYKVFLAKNRRGSIGGGSLHFTPETHRFNDTIEREDYYDVR